MPTRMGRTNAEATSPSSRGNERTGRENENTTVTRPATCEDRWCSRLTVTGEPGTPAVDSRRGRFALKPAIPWKGENLPLGLDFGGLIEGTENDPSVSPCARNRFLAPYPNWFSLSFRHSFPRHMPIIRSPHAKPPQGLCVAESHLVIFLDRMIDAARSLEWSRWVILLAAGGFAGNFVLSLADHAQNGFFYPTEWIGVVAGAIAVGFLVAAVIVPDHPSLLAANLGLMVIQFVVGSLGFYLHARGNMIGRGGPLWDRFIYAAPVFAPLLFVDLALLAMLGLWAQWRCPGRCRSGLMIRGTRFQSCHS